MKLESLGLSRSTINDLKAFNITNVNALIDECRDPMLDRIRFFGLEARDEIYAALEKLGVKCRLTNYEELYCSIFAEEEPGLRYWMLSHPFPVENLPALLGIINSVGFGRDVKDVIALRYGLYGDRPASNREIRHTLQMSTEDIGQNEKAFYDRMRSIVRVGKVRMLRYTMAELNDRISLYTRDLRDMQTARSMLKESQK